MGLADTLAAMKNGTPPAAPAASPNLGPALVGANPFAPSSAATAPPQASPPATSPNPFGAPAAATGGAVNPFAPVQGSAPPPAPPPVPGGLINPPERHVAPVEDPSEPLSAAPAAEAAPARGPGRPRKNAAAGAAVTNVAASSPAVEVAIVEALGAFSNLCNVLARKWGA